MSKSTVSGLSGQIQKKTVGWLVRAALADEALGLWPVNDRYRNLLPMSPI